MKSLGLDIGSNSVGSAWIDSDMGEIRLGVSVFPAGVEDGTEKRGAPKNVARRQKRSLRRSIRRRAMRKHALRRILVAHNLLPPDEDEQFKLNALNPWEIRARALDTPLTPYEFGRMLIHLAQRRGALGLTLSEEDQEDGKVKAAVENAKRLLKGQTYGQLMAKLYQERKTLVLQRYFVLSAE